MFVAKLTFAAGGPESEDLAATMGAARVRVDEQDVMFGKLRGMHSFMQITSPILEAVGDVSIWLCLLYISEGASAMEGVVDTEGELYGPPVGAGSRRP